MKYCKLLLLSVAVSLVVTVSVVHANPFGANPFGFKMGLSQDDVRNLKGVVVDSAWTESRNKVNQVLMLSKVPVPDERFVRFVLYFTEKEGLYTFHAISDTIAVGTGGSNLMPKYIELREELNKAYNGYTIAHYIENVPAWEPAGDWVLKVLRRSGRDDFRAFLSTWRPSRNKRSEEVGTVELSISLGNPAQILMIVDYHNYFDAVYRR